MEETENDHGRPPLVSTWRRLYILVLFNLALQIFLFYLFTKAFR
jgi:hypothetical protein